MIRNIHVGGPGCPCCSKMYDEQRRQRTEHVVKMLRGHYTVHRIVNMTEGRRYEATIRGELFTTLPMF